MPSQSEQSALETVPGESSRSMEGPTGEVAGHSCGCVLEGMRRLGAFMPEPLLQQVTADPTRAIDLAALSTKQDATIMFTDIVGFTTLAEGMSASEIAHLLNEHFTLVTGAIEAQGGIVDKYLGDGVMAVWPAPEDARISRSLSAVRAAMQITDHLAQENERNALLKRNPIRLSIGIHAGSVVIGPIGAPNRLNFTVVGDAVNVAQRLERYARSARAVSGNEKATALTMLSKAAAQGLNEDFRIAPTGHLKLKGRRATIEAYALLGRRLQAVVP